MDCPHKDCQRKFSRPLELFNGKWFCPHCRKDIFPNESTVFEVTTESHEKLLQSEKYFNEQWLLNNENTVQKQRLFALQQAVALCVEAVYLKNPFAMVNLGFYFEHGYTNPYGSREECLRSAYLFYHAVCFNNAQISDSAENLLTESTLTLLKKQAGLNLYSLLKSIPSDSAGAVLGQPSMLQQALQSVTEQLKKLGVATEEVAAFEVADSGVDVDKAFSAMCGEGRQLFGIYLMTADELKRLDEKRRQNIHNVKSGLGDSISKGRVKVSVAPAWDENEAKNFVDLLNSKSLKGFVDKNIDSEEKFFLFFFRMDLVTQKLKKKEVKDFYKALVNERQTTIKEFIKARLVNSYLFSEDDLFMFLNPSVADKTVRERNRFERALKMLLNFCVS